MGSLRRLTQGEERERAKAEAEGGRSQTGERASGRAVSQADDSGSASAVDAGSLAVRLTRDGGKLGWTGEETSRSVTGANSKGRYHLGFQTNTSSTTCHCCTRSHRNEAIVWPYPVTVVPLAQRTAPLRAT